MVQRRILETSSWTWRKYRLIFRDIAGYVNDVEGIQTAVRVSVFLCRMGNRVKKFGYFNVEAERERKYIEAIDETHFITPYKDYLFLKKTVTRKCGSLRRCVYV
jgi:hypothetical protein